MRTDMILLRFGELTLKGRNRHRFENRAIAHLRVLLRPFPRVQISKAFGRLHVELNGEAYEEIAPLLKKVFGLSSFSPVRKTGLDPDEICQTALDMMTELPQLPETFKVSARRTNKAFPYDSIQIHRLVGSFLLQHLNGLKVDVHHPQTELRVEIRNEGAYLFSEVIPGLGGYPLGSNGKAMLMLSGGIDSPVAGWMAMRRGLEIEAVHFHSFPFTSERAQQKAVDLIRKLTEYGKSIRLHMVPFTEIQTGLRDEGRENLLVILMRRAMFRIAEKLARRSEALAIVTGENLGQVASQTLPSLHATGQVCGLPILRPLIMMDKIEIIRIAEELETYPISIQPYEDCCTLFLPKSPSTNPNLRVVEKIEGQMAWLPERIDEAIARTETRIISVGGKKSGFETFF